MSKNSYHSPQRRSRDHERGGATLKFMAVVLGIFIAGHAAYNYLMVWYQSAHFKDVMNESVTQAFAMPNSPLNVPENLRQKLRRAADEDGVPANALMRIDRPTGALQARVQFTREIHILPFDLYKYNYEFDYTAAPPSGFVGK